MLPTATLDHLTDKQTIRNSATLRIQSAFLAKLTAWAASQASNSAEPSKGLQLSPLEIQELVLAPEVAVGQAGGVTDEEVGQLAAYLLKACQGYMDAYLAVGFPSPISATVEAMRRFRITI